jgi:transposase
MTLRRVGTPIGGYAPSLRFPWRAAWEKIKEGLPGSEGYVGGTAKDNRLFIEAVLYRYRAGIPWRDLPERFGDYRSVHKRLSRWSESGVWERIFKILIADADNEYVMIDSTIVRAHQHSAGAQKKTAHPKQSVGVKVD